MPDSERRFVVQQYVKVGLEGAEWRDVQVLEAADAGAALQTALFQNPAHRVQSTTYRVCEEALAVNVSINLETVNAE